MLLFHYLFYYHRNLSPSFLLDSTASVSWLQRCSQRWCTRVRATSTAREWCSVCCSRAPCLSVRAIKGRYWYVQYVSVYLSLFSSSVRVCWFGGRYLATLTITHRSSPPYSLTPCPPLPSTLSLPPSPSLPTVRISLTSKSYSSLSLPPCLIHVPCISVRHSP